MKQKLQPILCTTITLATGSVRVVRKPCRKKRDRMRKAGRRG